MRTLLVTGTAGSGRSSVAAATALAAAREGHRTLVLSADREDGLGAALGAATGPGGAEAAPGLDARRVDPGARFRAEVFALQHRAGPALDAFGARRLDEEELTELPGAEEFALLGALREAAAGPYDLIVADLPSADRALELLALPERLRRYLERVLPQERQAARALRPVLAQLAGVPMPAQWLFGAAARWAEHLSAVQALIQAPGTAVRLVAEPGPAGAEAICGARLGLALHGLAVESLVANRTVPERSAGSADPWLASLAAQQAKTLAEWEADGGPAVHRVPHLGHDPRGGDDLAALGLPAPAEAGPSAPRIVDRLADDGVLVWHLPLPGAVREELDLVRKGDELLVTAGRFRRILDLPAALRRCTVAGAGLREGELCVRFAPDPDLWPRGT
ncbi:Anion-transporting ATPase [Streptomyces sp. YIM 130001]|uniref:ArsA family ATPase n=1 Tax=Streptomyces sp. YIM 130001 TaxID=2259644 RepID=UPI000E654D80|nr:ArsA-related P-loop ATPase [Streptomyces sp. YIM 130001]RII18247.1 Anion-transporting ATPase [Streptomyces sp. YIM 130001]